MPPPAPTQPVLDTHGWGHLTAQFHELSIQNRWREMPELVSDAMLEAFAAIGPPEVAARDVLDPLRRHLLRRPPWTCPPAPPRTTRPSAASSTPFHAG